MIIEKINIPNVYIIRGGSGSGKTTLSEKIGESYRSWGYFNLSTREELEKLECIIISGDAIYDGLFGHPVDISTLDVSDLSDIYYSELSEQIEICLSKMQCLCLVIEGITCYRYLDSLESLLKSRSTFLSFEMVKYNAYPLGICICPDDLSQRSEKLYPYSKVVKRLHELLIDQERVEMYDKAYQYFPDLMYQKLFSSNSPEKLSSLNVPDISGKRVLDVGCNLGYFVFQYRKMGAQADGLDLGKEFIIKASKFKNLMYVLDGINFYCGDILKFQEKKYDMISLLSAFHYFRDKQKNLLEKIYSLLNDNGLFIIEIGLSLDHLEISFVEKYTRMGVDLEPCHFPNEKAFHDMISGLFEIVFTGDSIQQSGDRLPRKVFHLKKILI